MLTNQNQSELSSSAAQARLSEKRGGVKLQPPTSMNLASSALQARFINQDQAALGDGTAMGGKYKLKVAGGAAGEKLEYPYLEHDYGGETLATKHAAMMRMQTDLATIGGWAPHASLTNQVSKATARTRAHTEWSHPDGTDYFPQDRAKYWPFAVDITYDYDRKSNTNATAGDVGISVFYAPGKYGYITEVRSDADAYDIQINEPADRLQLLVPQHGDYGDFSSEHSVDGKEDLTQSGIHMEDADGADALTKVVAEGARWNAVKTLSERSLLTNTSKFFPLNKPAAAGAYAAGENPPYILFQDLWPQWRVFGNAWGINNAAFVAELHGNALGKKKTDARQDALVADTHNLGL